MSSCSPGTAASAFGSRFQVFFAQLFALDAVGFVLHIMVIAFAQKLSDLQPHLLLGADAGVDLTGENIVTDLYFLVRIQVHGMVI